MSEDVDISDADFWKKAGDDLTKQEKYELAIESYKEAVTIDPKYIKAWNNLGYAYSKSGRVDEARKCKEKIDELKKLPQDPITASAPPIPAPAKQSPSIKSSPAPSPTTTNIQEEKSPGIAALFSLIPGLGQLYNGEVGKAIGILIGTLIGLLILVIPGLAVWAYGMYDSYKTAQKMNAGEIPYKSTNNVALIFFGGFAGILTVFFLAAAIMIIFIGMLFGSAHP